MRPRPAHRNFGVERRRDTGRAVCRIAVVLLAVLLSAEASLHRAALAQEEPVCPGDCDQSMSVDAEELATGARAIFDATALEACPAFLGSGESQPGAADLVAAVVRAIHGCAVPEIVPGEIYRTYPGFEIHRPIDAFDAAERPLQFTSGDLPDGASFDGVDGIFSWVPGENQLGPFYVPYEVFPAGIPALAAAGTLTLKVSPLDACAVPSCSPVFGCTSDLVPLDTLCCSGEPEIRVTEPDAGCAEGRVLQVGRNTFGFGQLYNCNRIKLIAQSQSGVLARINIRARCIGTRNLDLQIHMETEGQVHTGYRREVDLTNMADGFDVRSGILFQVNNATPALEGAEADLMVTLSNPLTGATATEKLRLTLTHGNLPDLIDF